MPFNIGGGEALFLLVIVLIVFGAGRLPEVLGQLGKGVRSFRQESSKSDNSPSTPALSARTCAACGNEAAPEARFCAHCGKAL